MCKIPHFPKIRSIFPASSLKLGKMQTIHKRYIHYRNPYTPREFLPGHKGMLSVPCDDLGRPSTYFYQGLYVIVEEPFLVFFSRFDVDGLQWCYCK